MDDVKPTRQPVVPRRTPVSKVTTSAQVRRSENKAANQETELTTNQIAADVSESQSEAAVAPIASPSPPGTPPDQKRMRGSEEAIDEDQKGPMGDEESYPSTNLILPKQAVQEEMMEIGVRDGKMDNNSAAVLEDGGALLVEKPTLEPISAEVVNYEISPKSGISEMEQSEGMTGSVVANGVAAMTQIQSEEEAKAILAEKRRLAREAKEREMERQRVKEEEER